MKTLKAPIVGSSSHRWVPHSLGSAQLRRTYVQPHRIVHRPLMFGLTARIRARRLNGLALHSWKDGDEAAADRFAEQAGSIMETLTDNLGDAVIRAEALLMRGQVASTAANHAAATRRLEAAVVLLEKHAASKTRDLWLAETCTRLADTLRLAGRYPEADHALDKVFRLAHWDSLEQLRKAGALSAKGILCKDTGRYEEASVLYAEAFALTTAALGPDDPQVAAIHHNLAGLAHVQGHYADAEPHIRAALDIRHRNDHGNLAGIAADTSVLGAILADEGRLDDAETAIREALRLWTAKHGPDHYEVAVQLNNLAFIQHRRHEYRGAEDGYTRALEIKRRVLGKGHPEIAALLNNLASLESDLGRMSSAALHYDQAIAILAATLGPQHPNTQACIANRSRVQRQDPDANKSAEGINPRPSL